MRNLKRALSLTLASVMLLGMMVVSSSAAAGYSDVTDENNVEAIEVLQTIEVMVGDERGFGPERPVNRAEMAVVMGKLLNLDYDYYATSCPFNDVYDWARGYVGACYANKIVSGRGEGVYDPGATVTAVEAASMLMRALGYFQYANDVADGFELSTVRQGTKIGIFDGVGSSATAPMTRDQVAQMVLNALQTGMVEPDGQTINLTTPDGQVYTGKVNYVNVTSNKPFAAAINDVKATSVGSTNDGYIVDLGEQLYNGDLKLTKYDDDIFYRPSRHWEYKGQEVGTYMKKENIKETYTKGVSCRTLYDLIGRNNLNDYEFTYYVDGVDQTDVAVNYNENGILSRQDKDFGATGKGVLTQVFVDIEAETIDITSIHTWLAKATVDYSQNTEKATLEIYTGVTSNPLDTTETYKTVAKADVPEVENVKLDDYALVTMSGKNKASIAIGDLEVVSIDDVEILTNSTLTKFSNRSDAPNSDDQSQEALFKSVTTGGTEYESSNRAFYSDEVLELYDNQRLTDKAYNIYLDKYGYAIGVDLYSGGDNYVFIAGVKMNGSTISSTYADANAIFLDGTMKTINVNVKDTNKSIESVLNNSNIVTKAYFKEWNSVNYSDNVAWATMNRWFTYTVNADGVYTLTPAARMFTTDVNTTEYSGDNQKVIKCNNVVLDLYNKDSSDNSPHYTKGDSVRAYGNDDSIYIIPEVDNVSATGVNNKVISGVDALYTGVQDVEITVDKHAVNATITHEGDATEMYDSVYTVYDKNYYIIASVVLGEARGTSANYAYILSNAKSEELRDGTYYWEFDAVVNGTKTTLTAQSKFKATMNELRVGHVQELRYTGEYVTAIKDVSNDKIYTDTAVQINEKSQEIYDVGHDVNIGYAYDCKASGCAQPDTGRLTYNNGTVKYKAENLHLEGRTLKLGAGADYGLTFVDVNVPTVVIQPVDSERKAVQYNSVTEALAALGDADADDTNGKLGFNGRIVAALDTTGRAKWAVIISDTNVETVGANKTGTACKINIERYLNEGGVKELFRRNVKTVSTKDLLGDAWTIDVTSDPAVTPAVPGGYQLVGVAVKSVEYVKGQTEYTVEFNYVKGSARIISFNSNGGSPVGALMEPTAGAGVTLPAAPTYANHVFLGWGETPTATTTLPAGATYTGASDTVYAVWGNTVDFSLHATSSSGATSITGTYAPATVSETSYNSGIVLPGTGATDGLSNKGTWVLIGWATTTSNAAAMNPDAGLVGETKHIAAGTTLYTVWAKPYTVTFNGNSPTAGSPSKANDTPTAAGGSVTLAEVGTMTKTNKSFAGWTTTQDDASTIVTGTSYTPTADTTLYALWLSTVKTITVAGTATPSNAAANTATATAAEAGGTITITITAGTSNAANDTLTVGLTAPTGGSVSVSSLVVTYDGTNWSCPTTSVTVTAEDGSEAEYTVQLA